MPQTVNDIAQRISGEVPGLPALMARTYVNEAIQEIKKDYLWSWNIMEGILLCPAIITAGAVSVTFYSKTITFDANARALLDPEVFSLVPVIGRQFRVPGGPIYTIMSYQSDGTATLDRIYGETTNATSSYNIYKCYYGPPSLDGETPNYNFLRHLTINNPIQGYTISGNRLYMTRQTLNRKDPMRGAVGSPYYAAAFKPTPNALINGQFPNSPLDGIMQYELWPHPTYQVNLLSQFEAGHTPLRSGEYLPAQACEVLVHYRALEFAYRWGHVNSGRLKELRSVNWSYLIADIQKKYNFELMGAKRNDKEIMLNIIRPGSSGLVDLYGPIDSNFSQSHDYPAGYPNWF